MANINFEFFLGNLSFVILFSIMILYWIQAIFFIIPKFNSIMFLTTLFANVTLLILLILRWLNYGHFPLSNLYESLIFLSWSFTLIELFFIPSSFHLNLNLANLNILKCSNVFVYKNLPSTSYIFHTNDKCVKNTTSSWLENQSINLTSSSLSANDFSLNTVKTLKNSFTTININTIIGTVLSPIALFTNSFATFSLPKNMQKAQALVPALQSNWLMMHVTVMMLSYTALLCGSLLAITFLVVTWNHPQNNTNSIVSNNLSYKNKDSLLQSQELPINSLAKTLDNLSYRVLGIGFPLLTIGILSGAVWANEAWGSYWSWDPKETWAFITWLIFAIYLHTRITKGWEGKKPAILASFGFFIVWVCYLGVNILGTGLHSYGWVQLGT